MEHPLNIPSALPMALTAEARRAEEEFRRLWSTINNPKSLKRRSGTRRPRVSTRAEQYCK